MKKLIYILLFATSLYTGACKGEENTDVATSGLSPEIEPYRLPQTLPTLTIERGYLEEADVAIGVIVKSHHFDKYDYHDYNESHDGVYLSINRWSAGTFRNSADVRSSFITYNPNLYTMQAFMVNLVVGVADGYDGWEYAQGDYLPILGFSAQWSYLKAMMSYEAVAFGIELPLN